MKSVIITSTGRTGTYFLFRLLFETCNDCSVYHNSKYTALINIFSNAYLAGKISESLLRIIWRRLKSREVLSNERNTYIDSNNHLYALVSIAPDLYPDLSVIHLVRDPRDYVRSHINWAYSRRKSYLANFFIPFWQPSGYMVKEVALRKWIALDWFQRFCWIWDFKNRFIAKTKLQNIPYMAFRVEDLFNNNKEAYTELGEFMGFPVRSDIEIKDRNQSIQSGYSKIPHWTEWSDRRCAVLDDWCGRLMRKYDYGSEDNWREKVARGKELLARHQ